MVWIPYVSPRRPAAGRWLLLVFCLFPSLSFLCDTCLPLGFRLSETYRESGISGIQRWVLTPWVTSKYVTHNSVQNMDKTFPVLYAVNFLFHMASSFSFFFCLETGMLLCLHLYLSFNRWYFFLPFSCSWLITNSLWTHDSYFVNMIHMSSQQSSSVNDKFFPIIAFLFATFWLSPFPTVPHSFCLSLMALAAITKYYRLGGLNNISLFSLSFGG